MISKIRNQFLMELYVKLDKGKADVDTIKSHILEEISRLTHSKGYRAVRIIPDVDPY